jgi:hypothetical protein
MEHIAAAGNTEVPAFLALLGAGFEVSKEVVAGSVRWTATNGALRLVGDGPLQLLALYALRKERGADWKASDAEIDGFLAKYQA